jgi:hypothetical protein
MRLLLWIAAPFALLAATPAAAQDNAAALRASGMVGEQADGYLGAVVATVPAGLRAQMEAVNIRRRAHYTDLARRRGVRVEEVAVATACEVISTRLAPGHWYRLVDGAWRRRGAEAVPKPSYCQ